MKFRVGGKVGVGMSVCRILKFPLNEGNAITEIKCRFVQLLDIQNQRAIVSAWILTDSSAPEVTIRFVPVGTGWEIPSDVLQPLKYAKTVQDDFDYVWHYYMAKV